MLTIKVHLMKFYKQSLVLGMFQLLMIGLV
ncbi:hypothetical protein N184_32745 [Sinorhizobium sp. GL28]|nr:hypothetical protein N184_32745 [Sinorhizobium sp. GL28]